MNTRTITGTIVRPSGAAWSAATLTFKLRARFVVDSDTVLPDRVTATTDEDGAFSVALAVPVSGTASYEFTAPAGGSAVFYLEAGAPIELAVLLAARGVSVSPDAVAVEAGLRAAADAALQAQIDAGGGGGAVDSVNGQTGVVVLTASSVGADASGTAAGLVASEAATRAAADTTNATALTTHIADTANPHAVTAAQVGAYTTTQADTLLAAKQPLDSDLTAIAALTTTTYGRALLTAADAAGAQSLLSLGTLATQSSVTASQISDASTNGRSLLTAANYAAMKTLLSLNNVENTALSTWAGSTNITTLGTVASGTWQGGVIAPAYGGTGTANSGALAWPSGGGTVALLATANTFSAEQTIAQAVTGTPASGVVPQLKISNPSNANSRLQLYYDTTNNVGYIDAVTWGTATRALILNGSGGDVGIGSTSTPASGTVHIRKNLRVETSGASVTIINQTPTNYSFGQHVILDTFTIGPSSDGSGANSLSINTSGRIQAGGSTFTAKFSVTNNANIPALLVTGHTTQTTSTALAQLTRNDTAAGVSQLLLLTGLGSGANGDGAALSFAQKSSTTAARTTADFQALWATATDASRKARIVGTVYDTAAREWIRGEASGTAPMIGFLGASAVGVQSVGAAATDAASTQTLANNLRTALINLGLATT